MTQRKRDAVILAVQLLVGTVTAAGLPPAPTELGAIRRNTQGQLEAVGRPAELPIDTLAIPGPASPGHEGSGETGAGKRFPGVTAGGTTLVVGPHEGIRSIQEAARLARDGDTIEIRPGEYRQQAVVWTQSRLTIRGSGKRPLLIADGAHAEGKALWVVRNGTILIENLEFRGVRVADGNGAGIRFEKGHLRVVGCAFFDNEMGILSGNDADAVLEVEDSEFGVAPRHAGALHHLLYAGTIARLSVRGSRLQQGFRGHLIKSRARESVVLYNLLVDSPGGSASYELEFPNGGLAWVIGNVIGQSENTDNRDLVSYGAEGGHWADNALYLAHNTLIDPFSSGRFLRVWSDRMPPGTEAWALNNLLVGHGAFVPQSAGRFAGNQFVDRSLLVGADGLSYRLPNNSPLRGTAISPGYVRERTLTPNAEFRLPVGTRPLPVGTPLSPGALQ